MQYTAAYPSPLGDILLASDGSALTGLWFQGQKYFARTLDNTHLKKALPVFDSAIQWLDLYFSGEAPAFTPPLRPEGTPFQQEVWTQLLAVPYGETTTYGTLAAQIAKRRDVAHFSAQAVGGAVGHNPISIIIPCHRVLGAGGRLTGYAGGIEKKAQLLKLEAAWHPDK